ncbi:MAG TPA: C4-type zinc ribbon domain-containing protein [Ktedonobacteraceae bacterium]|nr:C4-type zinc ribbon domain-containing protein [Ktedonobacteraceae bacterium]
MSTTKIAATLFQLQQLDLELERLESEEQAALTSLQGNPRLQNIRAEHNIAQQQLRSGLQAQKEAEWALEELSQRLNTQEKRLYSGTVNNPKELYSLQQEVQRLRAQQNRQEDMALEVMEAAESLQEMAQRKAQTLEQAESAWARENEVLVARRDQLQVRKQELQANRAQMASSIAAEFVTRYDAMRRTRQGRAVSKVEQNSCQWCRVILTPSELQHVRTSKDLQTCTNCGRILYYDR